jgi:hypothetical protein
MLDSRPGTSSEKITIRINIGGASSGFKVFCRYRASYLYHTMDIILKSTVGVVQLVVSGSVYINIAADTRSYCTSSLPLSSVYAFYSYFILFTSVLILK